MSRSIIRYRHGDAVHWGELRGDAPRRPTDRVDLTEIAPHATTTADLILALEDDPGSGAAVTVVASDLVSPVTGRQQIVCQGLNYADHAAEASHSRRSRNLYFAKAASSLAGPYDDIRRPADVELLDFEVELGLVLRRDITHETVIDAATIGDYVAGVTLCNDMSARDEMFGAGYFQWYKGKSYRGFCPTGPVLLMLDPDEVAPVLADLEISLDWNGERRQETSTRQMIFPPAETLTDLSSWMDVHRGDLLLTGTCGGVIARASKPVADALRDHLFDDDARRSTLRAVMTEGGRFLEPGDVLTLDLRRGGDERSLGGQHTRIA